jgi:hypothetical protein
MPKFEHDIFISYAHIDNESMYGSEHGWIALLHKRLEIRLAQLLGRESRIWRDSRLTRTDPFPPDVLDQLSRAALLVSVLSPRYVNSDWCLRELNEFHKLAVKSDPDTIGNRLRILKTIKTPIELEEHPPVLQSVLGYEFYAYDRASDSFREFGYLDGEGRDPRYWDKLEAMAQAIKKLIKQLMGQTDVFPTQSPGKTIYLAETTSDLSEEHDCIRRELQLNGHRVLPDKPLLLSKNLREEINRCLAESVLSVHLVGTNRAFLPEGESKSIVEIQHELAAARSQSPDFSQIIWLPIGLDLSNEQFNEHQRKFIEELLNHLGMTKGTELLQTKLEDLKTFVHEKLNPAKPTDEPRPSTNGDGADRHALVYLVCDQSDYDAVAPIERRLFERGCEVLLPAGDIDPQQHKENLLLCDAVLIYCGGAADSWLNLKKTDLIKLPGYGRTEPLLAKGFYIGAPQTSGKERFRILDGLVIKNYGEFSPASLDPFIEQIERAKGARQ